MIRIWFLFARRSAGLPVALAIAGIYMWIGASVRRPELHLWSDIVTAISQTGLYTGVLAAGFCAWQSGRWEAASRSRLCGAVRSPAIARLSQFSVLVAAVGLGYISGLAALTIYAGASHTYGGPSTLWLVVLGAALMLAASFGYLIGRIGGARWWVPLAAALAFFGLYILSRSLRLPYAAISLFPVVTNSDSEFVRYVTTTMLGQLIFFSAMIGLIACGSVLTRPGRREALAGIAGAVVFVVVAVGGAAAIFSTNGQYTEGYNGRDFSCAGQAPRICLNRGYVGGMAATQVAFDRLAQKVDGTNLAPTLLEQNVEGVGDKPSAGARSIYFEDLTSHGIDFAVWRYVQKYGGFARCDPANISPDTFVAMAIVDTWISGYDEYQLSSIDPSALGAKQFETFTRLEPSAGNTWLKKHAHEYFACSLTLSDFK